MIVRRHSILVLTIALTFWTQYGSAKGERWSRQVLNSEWIPLANPRSLQGGGAGSPGNAVANPGVGNPAQLQPVVLPPVLREQYHQQLLQLQETQESIQKLLQLQQQLRAQQQLLQAQSYLPEGFSTDEERKSALHQTTIANVQSLPQFAPGALLPPPPGNQPQPPEFAAQDFLVANGQKKAQNGQIRQNQEAAAYNVNAEGQKGDRRGENLSAENLSKTRDYTTQQSGHYKNPKQLRNNQNGEQFVSPTTPGSVDVQNDGEEEVQLLYVPAETLAQRDQQQKTQRLRSRKQFSSQQQQQPQQQQQVNRQQNRYQQQPTPQQAEDFQSQGLEGTRPSAAQQNFAHQVLYQLQQEQAIRTRIQQEERDKELTRLRDEQQELERQAKLHQELVFKEQDLRRQKELALRKELERQEEEEKQKELQRIKELNQRKLLEEEAARKREAERQEELERQKIAEIRAQDRQREETEARQAEIDRLSALERQKELEIQKSIEQQQELERQQAEDEARARAQLEAQRQAQAQLEAHRKAHQEAIENQKQAQIDAAKLDAQNRAQNQAQQQHLTETTRPKSQRLKSRQRQRNRQEINQPTTPSPNQPPLSVYMGSINRITNPADLRVSDVLTILKDAKTISVLDTVGPDTPQVFVGPTNLEPPSGYAKFDLPYLSAIDNNRVERKVDKLPFFVAPLSFKPPPGYSKIPFPAPHIGSVVVNNLDNEPHPLDGQPGGILKTDEELRPSPTPLIEPNSYVEDAQLPAGNPYSQFSTPSYSQEALVATTTPKYEASYSTTPSSGTRYRHRQFYSDRSPHVVSTALYEDHSSTEPGIGTRTKFRQYFREEQGHETSNDSNGSTPSPQDNFQQDISAVNGEEQIGQHGDVTERYNTQSVQSDQQLVRNPFSDLSQGHIASELYNTGESQGLRSDFGSSQNLENQFAREPEDRRPSPGPTQYTIPSEFPRISPQLPGLVNSLIEGQEIVEKSAAPLTTTTTATTTTTTTEPSTTTYRSRGRQRGRIVPTRAPTTTESAPTKSPVADRSRRPYSRSRVRQGYPTTTETYQETIYEPTKPKLSGTQEKAHYSSAVESQRTSAPRSQRYRGRGSDRNAVQPEARPDAGLSEVDLHNPQSQDGNYANDALRHSLQEPSAPVQNPNAPVYQEDGFLSAAIPSQNDGDNLTPNAQPLQGTVSDTALTNDNGNPAFPQNSNYEQSNVEQSPVNGFNYQSQDNKFGNIPEPTAAPPQYSGNSFNGQRPQNAEQVYSFHGIHAGDSPGKPNINNFQNTDLNREQIYGSQASGNRHSVPDSDILKSDGPGQDADDRPVYDHLKDENTDFLQAPSTTTEAPEVTTPRPILTPAPVIVRQRVRGRLNQNTQRVHVDAAIQTRPSGSRDEFVRFSAVNQDNRQHSSPGRIHTERTRPRIRSRGRNDQPNVQTEGSDYVRIQSPVQRPTTTTTTTTTTEAPQNYPKDTEEEIEYGFIRPPSFKPIHPVNLDRPVGNAGPTYRPKYEQAQTEEPTNDAPLEVNTAQSQTLKNRQKYHVMNRRPLTRLTTASPPLASTSTETRVEEVYTAKPKAQNDELKGSKNRGRIRRPGKRRTTTTSTTTTTTTTTTESILDSSNELPLDENYPQIIQGLPALADQPRRTLFDEELKSPNLEALPQAVALQRPTQLQSFQNQENQQFPRQEFVLNFGIGSEHDKAHEEYDQTQLASSHQQQKYNHPNRGSSYPHPAGIPVADIEGAESQWSTKLTHSSFQPSSLLNQLHTEAKSNERQEKSDDSFDIITAGPELASADGLVTGNNSSAPRDIVVNTSYLGNAKKEGLEVQGTWEAPILQGRSIVEGKNETFKDDSGSLDSLQFWNNGQGQKIPQENGADLNPGDGNGETMIPRITEEALNPVTDVPKTESNDATSLADSEIGGEPTTTKRSIQRRRRVRIRVRPADDFVSAESQHVSSVWNSLISGKQNHEKTGGFDGHETTTISPTPSTTDTKTVKSFLDELLDEMDKNIDVENSTTTNVPDNTEPTADGLPKISEEIYAGEVATTPETTTTTRKPDFSTTIGDSVTTLGNEKFATETTTEYHNFSPKSEERKKFRPTEPILEHTNRFHSFQPQKNWRNHNYDAVTKFAQSKPEEEPEMITPRIVMDRKESPIESTTITNAQEHNSASENSLSDYVDAFFKTMEVQEDQKAEETERRSDYGFQMSDSKKKLDISAKENKETKTTSKAVSEEQKGDVSGLVKSSGVYDVEEVGEEKKVTKMEDELTSKKVEGITETSEQDVTTNFAPITTPEVPFSPEELTTEMPGATTTVKSNINANQFAKVLRTSTTTEISHMTEICYRGRCVKSKSQKEVKRR